MFSEAVIIVPVLFYSLVTIIRIVSDNRLKRIMIERGNTEGNLELLTASSNVSQSLNSLKWGIVLVGVGLAFLLGDYFRHAFTDEGLLGLVATFAGAGMLIFHFLATKSQKELS